MAYAPTIMHEPCDHLVDAVNISQARYTILHVSNNPRSWAASLAIDH